MVINCCFNYCVCLQVMCVLMVCFNVLELLLDETAMPRGMEVRIQSEHFMLGVPQPVICVH